MKERKINDSESDSRKLTTKTQHPLEIFKDNLNQKEHQYQHFRSSSSIHPSSTHLNKKELEK